MASSPEYTDITVKFELETKIYDFLESICQLAETTISDFFKEQCYDFLKAEACSNFEQLGEKLSAKFERLTQ